MGTKMVIPASATELEEMLNNAAVIKNVMTDPETRKDFLRKYVAVMGTKDPDLQAQLKEQIQAGMAEFIRENGGTGTGLRVGMANGKPTAFSPDGTALVAKGRGAAYNKAAWGARMERALKLEDRFGTVGELCQAIREEARPSSSANHNEMLRKLENIRSFQNSFGSEDPGAGGFLIPEIMRSELLELALEESIVRSRATVIPMSTLRVPIPTVDDTSHVSSLFGGVVFYWTEESASLTESQATFGRVVLDAKKLTGFFKVPNELLADAPAFSSWFDTRIPQGLAWYEDKAFLTETGAGTPMGVINAPGAASVTRAGSPFNWVDITTMYSRMLPTSQRNGVWVLSHDSFPTLAQLTLSTPGIWMGGYNAPPASDAPPVTIMGRPVIFTEKVPKSGTAGDVSFIDFSYYLIGDRQAVAVSASEHFAFQNDQTAYRIIERVDGRPWLQSALTPANGSTSTLSAYVVLH